MTVADISATSEPAMDTRDARALTDQIKVTVEGAWHLIERAYVARAWAALGYRSWDDYCQREFGTSRLRLPREERQEVVASLRESGLSTRAIAAATGIDRNTVMSDLRQVAEIPPVAPPRIPAVSRHANTSAEHLGGLPREPDEWPQPTESPAAPRITGVNGKAYAPTRPASQAKPRTDVPRVVNSALIQIDNARRTLQALTDGQVAHQSEEARSAWAANLSESIEALTGFLENL